MADEDIGTIDIVDARCPFCKTIEKCELLVTGCMSAQLKCLTCNKTWREESDYF